MSYYDYYTFVHPVPAGHVVPKGTPVRRVDSAPHIVEAFLTMLYDAPLHPSDKTKYYLNYDITKPTLPDEINTVIYNVRTGKSVFPVAVYQGHRVWCAFTNLGERKAVYSDQIESYDTTPSKEER